MKKLVSLTLAALLLAALVTLLSLAAFSASAYTDITTAAELKAMKSTGNYRLKNDIVLSDGTTLAAFSGNLDGNGKKITGLTAPLFASLAGSVSDLTIEGSITSSATSPVGALANSASADLAVKGVTVNCPVKATSATGVGGFIGSVSASSAVTVAFENCLNKGSVDGLANVGGFVGQVSNSSTNYSTVSLTLCINEGSAHMSSMNANVGVAGIVGFGGRYSNVVAEKCSNRGNISSEGGDSGVAGIYGGGTWAGGDAQKFTARYCSNRGNITVPKDRGRVGGICGRMNRNGNSYIIEYCYNTGAITAANDSAAGIFSYSNSNAAATIRYCYNVGTLKSTNGGVFPIAAHGAKNTVVTKDLYYVGTSTNNTGENVDAVMLSDKEALNAKMLSLTDSPFTVVATQNGGYAMFAWECAHASVKDTCTGKICGECGTVLEEKAGTHSFGSWIVDKPADSTEDGLRHRECSKCHVVESEIIPATTSVTPINGVYSVKNASELIWVLNGLSSGSVPANASIKLTADIDVEGKTATVTTTFTGVFDGNSKTIDGLSKTMFKQFNGTVKDLCIKGDIDYSAVTDFDTARKAASFAHNSEGGTFINLVSYVNVTTKHRDINAGGIVGYAKVGNLFKDCQYLGTYTLEWTGDGAGVGGIVGWSNASGGTTAFENCVFGGKITVKGGAASKETYIGGILGNATNATVTLTNCSSKGSITSQITAGTDYVGGILGMNKNAATVLQFCANKSAVEATANAGGIVGGTTESLTLTSCSNLTKPTGGSAAGALCGSVSSGKSAKFVSSADLSASGLKLCGSGSNVNNGSYAWDKVTDLEKDITLDGKVYHRYSVCYVEKESGILVTTLSTKDKFTPYISIRDDGKTHAVRFVILTNRAYDTESVTVSILFKDGDGKTAKSLVKKLAVTDSDFTLYSAVLADGVPYFAASGNALFGLVVKDIPMGAWDSIEVTVTDTKEGTVYLAPMTVSTDSITLTLDSIPDFSSLGNASPVYNCGPGLMSDRNGTTDEDSFMTVISNTTAAKLSSYVATLPNYGYEFINKNTLDGDTYYTFKKFGSLLYLYHSGRLGETRIIADNASDLLEEINYAYTKKAGETTEFYQYSINYQFNNHVGYDPVVYTESGSINCGMCYIIKLPDNKVILIDSAHETQSTAKSRAGLLKFLRQITGTKEGEKVEIAMWFFTHAHGDHVRLASDFIAEYHNEILLESVTHNFPSYQAKLGGYDDNTFSLKTNINKYFPDVTYHKLHTGEILDLAGVTMDVVFTHEDMVNSQGKSRVSDFNSTSTVLKIHMDGKSIMLLADLADDAEDEFIALHNASYFKSDIVQVAHHGFNYLSNLYPLINAPIAIFPQSMFNMKDPANSQSNLPKYKIIMTYSKEEYFAHKWTYKFTVENNGVIKVDALPRYDAQ